MLLGLRSKMRVSCRHETISRLSARNEERLNLSLGMITAFGKGLELVRSALMAANAGKESPTESAAGDTPILDTQCWRAPLKSARPARLLLQTLSDRPPGEVRRHPAPETSAAGRVAVGERGVASCTAAILLPPDPWLAGAGPAPSCSETAALDCPCNPTSATAPSVCWLGCARSCRSARCASRCIIASAAAGHGCGDAAAL